MTKPKRLRNNGEAWKYVDKQAPYVGSSTHGQTYLTGSAPHLSVNDTWMSEYETGQYAARRPLVTYIVWSFATPIAYHVEGVGWYKVGQTFSSFTSRHANGALRNIRGHDVRLDGSRGDWTVRCLDCGTERHFTREADAQRVLWPHR